MFTFNFIAMSMFTMQRFSLFQGNRTKVMECYNGAMDISTQMNILMSFKFLRHYYRNINHQIHSIMHSFRSISEGRLISISFAL